MAVPIRNFLYKMKSLLSTCLSGSTKHHAILMKPQASAARYATEATFDASPFKLHNLKEGPKTKAKLTKQEANDILKKMVIIRQMEQQFANMYRQKHIRGFLHLYSGEEAVACGIKSMLSADDRVITAYRCHGWCYLFAGSVTGLFTELAGKANGLSKGKGGSMHLYAEKFYGGNGIVGAQVPLGTGVALALKLQGKGKNTVSVTLYGDGAANQGQVFEAYNLAKLHMLPVIYVCENNQYGMGTSTKRASANPEFYTRCDYIPGILADGMDVFAMREVTRFAREWCTQGKGPIIIEARTYRYFGHSMSDPGKVYRSREEVQKMRQERDPINNYKKKILAAGLITKEEIDKITKDTKEMIAKASKLAIAASTPTLTELAHDVYANNIVKTCRYADKWSPLPMKATGKLLNIK